MKDISTIEQITSAVEQLIVSLQICRNSVASIFCQELHVLELDPQCFRKTDNL